MKKHLLPYLLIFIGTTASLGQEVDLRKDSVFFAEQAMGFQDWLKRIGLHQIIEYDGVEIGPSKVQLNLTFKSTLPDSISLLWQSAQHSYAQKSPNPLEEDLLLKLLRLFDLDLEQGVIRIQGTPPWEYIEIYINQSRFVINDRLSKRDFKDYIKLKLDSPARANATGKVRTSAEIDAVYEKVKNFVEHHYKDRISCNSTPNVNSNVLLTSQGKKRLMIRISGLCHQVFPEDQEIAFCEILQKLKLSCQSINRETLDFSFDYFEESRILDMKLDGKYRSDYVLFQGWRLRDMDENPTFEGWLEDYGYVILNEVKVWIEQ